jgi:spore maturation protein CgeB
MRILSVVRRGYYGSTRAVEPMFLYFTRPLQGMGHEVETFDPAAIALEFGDRRATDRLSDRIRSGAFDLVLYQNGANRTIDTSALRHLSRRFCIVAWNSDDDWQWESCTSHSAGDFTYVVTTYPQVFAAFRDSHPNLLLSQWGCYSEFSNFNCPKDIDFSFAGAVYGTRNSDCRYLRKAAGLKCFGRGAQLVNFGLPYFRGVFRLPWLSGFPLDFKAINGIWNRSRVSFTPMAGGPSGNVLSIKSRAFDMGLSGALMLCENSPHLQDYYEPGKEFVPFESLEACVDKACFYTRNESARRRIAEHYRDRTLSEHLWEHRFGRLFAELHLFPTRH